MNDREDGSVEAVPGWISEATWCQQLPICHCVPVKASVWQQACDLAPSTTPCREARPGVTDPLTGCSPPTPFPSIIHSSSSPFSLDFAPCHIAPICSHFLQQPFCACSALVHFIYIKKRLDSYVTSLLAAATGILEVCQGHLVYT